MLTCDALAVHGGHVLELGLLDRVAGDRAARERSVRGEGAVDVADAVAAGRRAVDALELHGRRRCDDSLVLLDRAARLEDPHLVPIRDWAARRAVIINARLRAFIFVGRNILAALTMFPLFPLMWVVILDVGGCCRVMGCGVQW